MLAHHLSHVNEHLGKGTESFRVGLPQELQSASQAFSLVTLDH